MDENYGFVVGEEDHQALDLPPGFRFHPTDEELITHYLSPKAIDSSFCARAIGEVDLNKCEPWDLPKWAKMGEKEWYFFCLRDRKYPTGLRTNRATEAGYWKATGKDKEIYREKSLVGMKKTLVFYKGRAPKGQKSNWVMHEFRLEGRLSLQNLPSSSKNEWVISRIFHKNPGGKTHPFPGLIRTDPSEIEPDPTGLPPLMESSPCSTDVAGVRTSAHAPHVSCFSGSMLMDGSSSYRNDEEEAFDSYINYNAFNPVGASNSAYMNMKSAFDYSGQNHILKSILENQREYEGKPHMANSGISQDTGLTGDTIKGEISSVRSEYQIERQPLDDDQVGPSISGGPIDLDVLWNF